MIIEFFLSVKEESAHITRVRSRGATREVVCDAFECAVLNTTHLTYKFSQFV